MSTMRTVVLLAAALSAACPCPSQLPQGAGADARPSSELARLPFERHMNLIFVEAQIGDSGPLTFLIDSGAGGTVLEESVADRVGLEMGPPRVRERSSSRGRVTLRVAPHAEFTVGGHSEELSPVLVTSFERVANAMTGRTVHGILGHQFLTRVTLEVDYVARELVLHDPETYRYDGGGAELPLEFDSSSLEPAVHDGDRRSQRGRAARRADAGRQRRQYPGDLWPRQTRDHRPHRAGRRTASGHHGRDGVGGVGEGDDPQ